MEECGIAKQKYNFFCFRCGCIIKKGERMLNLSVTLEAPTKRDTIEVIDATAISTLCPGCASVLLTKAIASDSRLMMPREQESEDEEIDEDEMEDEIDIGFSCFKNVDDMLETIYYGSPSEKDDEVSRCEVEEDKPRERLIIRYSSKGFRLVLDCGDGSSKATSQLFTWRQIAQMLIAMDPDMFGVLNEPLHQVFPRSLSRLGYHVPGWRDPQHGHNSN